MPTQTIPLITRGVLYIYADVEELPHDMPLEGIVKVKDHTSLLVEGSTAITLPSIEPR
jgi:hypothetical protein